MNGRRVDIVTPDTVFYATLVDIMEDMTGVKRTKLLSRFGGSLSEKEMQGRIQI